MSVDEKKAEYQGVEKKNGLINIFISIITAMGALNMIFSI